MKMEREKMYLRDKKGKKEGTKGMVWGRFAKKAKWKKPRKNQGLQRVLGMKGTKGKVFWSFRTCARVLFIYIFCFFSSLSSLKK
jgi:hypothetical protein